MEKNSTKSKETCKRNNKMRIGILTLPLNTNYGGILQAYALQTVLDRMGHEVRVISFPYLLAEPNWITYLKRYVKKYILRHSINIYGEKRINDKYRTIHKNLIIFMDKYIKRVFYKRLEEIKIDDFDAFVVGSDQVWRYEYGECFDGIENAYLQFTKGWSIKRVSYAASFGLSDWVYSIKDQQTCSELLKSFDAVSVREIDAVNLCRDFLGCSAELVLDPTMLLTKQDYQQLIINRKRTLCYLGDLFCYMLDSKIDISSLIKELQTEYIPFTVNSRCDDESAPVAERIHPSVEQWLKAFDDAKMVVTDSFHGCVFSIIFNKPFVVYLNHKGGTSRIYSLLSMFGLENRIIDEKLSCLNNIIDWDEVNGRLEVLRKKSLMYLNNALLQ